MAKKQTNDEQKTVPSLKRVVAEINKKYGENIIGTLPDMASLSMERISSGVNQLDLALGGGFPTGRIVELYGLPSGGKSLITLKTIAEAQKKGLSCIYIDAEDSFDPIFAQSLGVDTKTLYVAQSSVGETTIDLMVKLLESEPGVIVLDSVAALVTKAEMEESMDQQFMAVKARLMSRALAKLNALNKKTLMLFINQLRSTMAMYGPQTTTPGGRALGHYSSIRVEIKKGDFLRVDGKKTTDIIGQQVKFQITKNKTFAPYRYGSFELSYEGMKIE
jgi:recombination protein RecA